MKIDLTNKFSFLFLFLIIPAIAFSQREDSIMIRKIFEYELTKGRTYPNLTELCAKFPKRVSGSKGAAGSVEFMKQLMMRYGFDSVWLQPCYVPQWVNRDKEVAYAETKSGNQNFSVAALGNSSGTGPQGLTAPVIEVKNFSELDSLGKKNLEGKIVFYNHPFNDAFIDQGAAYGSAVRYRGGGASRAAKYGAVGVVVRSMTSSLDDYPHTGAMRYNDSFPKIPAIAISTLGANRLSEMIRQSPDVRFFFRTTCEMMKDSVLSYNVIGELRGTEFPDTYITVGGHLDAWETGDGAHDDGAGCMQSLEVLALFKELGIRPRHTIRAVMFMNEENGTKGAIRYAAEAKRKNETHLFALESDAGAFTPQGFSFSGDTITIKKIQSFGKLFEPYHIYEFEFGGTGADIDYLKGYCKVLCGFRPDGQRYFNYHHAGSDVIENVNKRELELGSAAITALIYLIDKHF